MQELLVKLRHLYSQILKIKKYQKCDLRYYFPSHLRSTYLVGKCENPAPKQGTHWVGPKTSVVNLITNRNSSHSKSKFGGLVEDPSPNMVQTRSAPLPYGVECPSITTMRVLRRRNKSVALLMCCSICTLHICKTVYIAGDAGCQRVTAPPLVRQSNGNWRC